MKNTTVKITSILVALASVMAVAGTSCGKYGKKDDGALIYKEKGKIYYRKTPEDNAYELVTDSKGETVVDEHGNLLWKVTDAKGQEQTMPVSYPSHLIEGGKISCQEFTITVPKGYENIGNDVIYLRNSEEGTQIDYSLFDTVEEGKENTAAQRAQDVLDMFKETSDQLGTIKQDKVQIGGRDAIRVTIDISKTEKKSYMEAYYIDCVNGVMAFSCSCKYEDKGKVNFKSILDTIEYRV